MKRILLALLLVTCAPLLFASELVTIGVLSHRGDIATLAHWSKTADYLSTQLPDCRFPMVPLDFSEVDPAVGDGSVDFILVNPAMYVNLEVRHRVSRIATMKNRWKDEAYNLTTKVNGVTKTKHIPKEALPLVRKMTGRHQKLKELLKKLSEVNWLLVREGEDLRQHGSL